MPSTDVIVIGAGAMGSAAAYHLAKAGQRVLLLEQFEIDHQKGSSYGFSRIIRYAYDHPVYIALAKAVYPLWYELQEEAGERLIVQTGGLDFGTAEEVSSTLQTMRAEGIPHEDLSADEANARFPQFRFDEAMRILYQPESGLLAASKCVRAHIQLARQHGADVKEHTRVTRLDIKPGHVEVETTAGAFQAERLIITAGAWTRGLLASIGLDLPLQPVRCQEAHFQPVTAPNNFTADHMPVFISHGTDEHGHKAYGLPSVDGSGVKVAYHGGTPVDDPSQIDYEPSPEMVEHIRTFARKHLPVIGDSPLALTRICLYTMTPDEHFIIDRHPEHSHVIIASPCSGHGFKFSTLIGRILTDLALRGRTEYDISLFNVNRFVS